MSRDSYRDGKENLVMKIHFTVILNTPASTFRNNSRSAQVWHVFSRDLSFTCTSTRSPVTGMSHTCLRLPSYNWHSFSDTGGMERRVGLGGMVTW